MSKKSNAKMQEFIYQAQAVILDATDDITEIRELISLVNRLERLRASAFGDGALPPGCKFERFDAGICRTTLKVTSSGQPPSGFVGRSINAGYRFAARHPRLDDVRHGVIFDDQKLTAEDEAELRKMIVRTIRAWILQAKSVNESQQNSATKRATNWKAFTLYESIDKNACEYPVDKEIASEIVDEKGRPSQRKLCKNVLGRNGLPKGKKDIDKVMRRMHKRIRDHQKVARK